jgi:Flp pilus assembly protein TadG
MIETAMMLPVLLVVAFGTLEFSMMFARYQILLTSARQGARVASLYREECNSRRVKGEVDAIVMANGNHLGMFILPTNVRVSGACNQGNVTVDVTYRHYITLMRGLFATFGMSTDAAIPLVVSVVMRNEIS